VDRVLRRCRDVLAVRTLELDAIEPLPIDLEAARERPVRLPRERRRRRVLIEHDAPGRRRHRRRDTQAYFCTAQLRHVARALHFLRRETGISGEVILELELP